MSTELVMPGVENLEGRDFGSIRVLRISSRRPLTWGVACTKCGSSWTEPHLTVRGVQCRNDRCRLGFEVPKETSRQVELVPTGVRSRDAESARRFEVLDDRPKQPEVNPFSNADPDGLRHYLDYMKRKNATP